MKHTLKKILSLFKPRPASQPSYVFSYSRKNKPDGVFDNDFHLNLKRTIAWTEQIIGTIKVYSEIDYSRVLRTTNLIYEEKPFYTFKDASDHVYTPNLPFHYKRVLEVALSLRPDADLSIKDLNAAGRILRFEIDVTTHDGAPGAESSGFIDMSDIPPIDTWFYLTKKYLYCWIPALFIDKMQGAIDVDFLDSSTWFSDVNPEFNDQTISKLQP